MVFPRPKLTHRVPAHRPEVVLKLITSNDPPPVNIRVVIGKAAATSAGLQTAAWHQSAIRILRASDSDATKFAPGSTERRGPSVPRQSVSQETPATLL